MLDRIALESQLAAAREIGDASTEASLLVQLGHIAKDENEFDLAQGLYGQAWAAYERAGDARGATRTILALVRVFGELWGNTEDFEALFIARAFCEQALKIGEQIQDYGGQGRAWKIKADLIGYAWTDEEVKQATYETAYTLCEKGEDSVGQAEAAQEIGIIYDGSDDTKAEALFSKALSLYQQGDSHEGTARILIWLGKLKARHSDPDISKEYYQRAINIYEDLNQPLEVASLFEEIGDLENRRKNPNLAVVYRSKALILYENYGEDPGRYANAVAMLGYTTFLAKGYPEAKVLLTRALELCDKSDSFIWADRLFSLAQVYAATDDFILGRQYAEQAIRISTDHPHQDHLFNRILMRWRWGEIEYKAGHQEKARFLCSEAFVLAQEIPFGRHILDVWEQELTNMGGFMSSNSGDTLS